MERALKSRPEIRIVGPQTEWAPKHLDVVACLFVTVVLVSNVAAQKLFCIGSATFTAGIVVFPLSYVLGDVLTEVYGFRRARRVICVGLLANVFMATVLWVVIQLPPAPNWHFQSKFTDVLGFVPRIVLASIGGYLIGELANSAIMSRLKLRTSGRHLWLRTISSTVVGQFLDTVVFLAIAFVGVMPLVTIIKATIYGWLFKSAYEAIVTPFTYAVVGRLKILEGVDYFDAEN